MPKVTVPRFVALLAAGLSLGLAVLLPATPSFGLGGPLVTERVSVSSDGNQVFGSSRSPSITADGRFVAFESFADTLVAGDTNGTWDIFVHDRQIGRTERVSIATDGTEGDDLSRGATIGAEGRFVAFGSAAGTLVADDTNDVNDAFVHDRRTGTTERVSIASDGTEVTTTARSPPSAPTAASLRFGRLPATWSRATRTGRWTSSCATAARPCSTWR